MLALANTAALSQPNPADPALRVLCSSNPFHLRWRGRHALVRVFEYYYYHNPGIPSVKDPEPGGFVEWTKDEQFGGIFRVEIRDKKLPFLLRLKLPNPQTAEAMSTVIAELTRRLEREEMKLATAAHTPDASGAPPGTSTLSTPKENKKDETRPRPQADSPFPVSLAVVDDEIVTAGNHILDLIGVLTVCFEVMLGECLISEFHRVCKRMLDIIRVERLTAISKLSYREYWEALGFTNVLLCRFALLYEKSKELGSLQLE